ncbi:MAG: hypothetical protein ACPGMX_11485, partial [Paracoccaceae bacterium]
RLNIELFRVLVRTRRHPAIWNRHDREGVCMFLFPFSYYLHDFWIDAFVEKRRYSGDSNCLY